MSREMSIIMLGVLVALMPFLGFPRSWENIIFIVFGLLVVLLALIAWLEKRYTHTTGKLSDVTYVESNPHEHTPEPKPE